MLKKVLTTLTFISISTSSMAGLVYSIEGSQEITLKRISNKRFEKIAIVNNGTEKLMLGSKILGESTISIPDDGKKFALEATGKNIVRVEDESENINQEIEASIESSLFGKVKSIKISGENTEVLYAKAYERTGLDVLKKLRLSGIAKSDLAVSDLDCISAGDLLKCTQESVLTFEFTTK